MWSRIFFVCLVYIQQIVCKNFNVYYVSWINNPPYYIKGHPRIGMVPQTVKYHFPSYIMNDEKDKFRFNYIDDPKYHLETEKQLIDLLKEKNKTRLLQRLNTTENSSDIFIALSTTKRTPGFFKAVPIIKRQNIAIIMRTSDLLLFTQFGIGIINCQTIIFLAVSFAINLGVVIWLIEHTFESSSHFHNTFGAGLWTSFWFCFVTMTTVGYGDKVPKHFISRILCLFWMVYGLMLTAIITTSVMQTVQGESSKTNMRIGVLPSNIETSFVRNQFFAYPISYDTNEEIMSAVKSRDVDAGMLDSNVAAYVLRSENVDDLKVETMKTLHKTVYIHVYYNTYATNVTFDFNDNMITVPEETTERVQTLFVPNIQVAHYYARSLKEELLHQEEGGMVFYTSVAAGVFVVIALLVEIAVKCRQYFTKNRQKRTLGGDNNRMALNKGDGDIVLENWRSNRELEDYLNTRIDGLKEQIRNIEQKYECKHSIE